MLFNSDRRRKSPENNLFNDLYDSCHIQRPSIFSTGMFHSREEGNRRRTADPKLLMTVTKKIIHGARVFPPICVMGYPLIDTETKENKYFVCRTQVDKELVI